MINRFRLLWKHSNPAKNVFLATYGTLSLIPISCNANSGYHYMNYLYSKDEKELKQSKAMFFWAVTGYLSLPLSLIFWLATPYALIFDQNNRKILNDIQNLWGRLSLNEFFVEKPEIISIDNGYEELQTILKTKDKSFITISNHSSWLDIYSLFFLDIPIRFISKHEIFYIPLVGWIMNFIGHISVNRKDKKSRKSIVTKCIEELTLENDPVKNIHFFAEGTRSRTGKIGEFKLGAFKVSKNGNIPIIPIKIENTIKILPPDEELTNFNLKDESPKILIKIYPPIYPKENESSQDLLNKCHALYA